MKGNKLMDKLHRLYLPILAALLIAASALFAQPVRAVEAVGMTVSDLDRAVEFYSKVLTFQPVSDREIYGPEIEQLSGVFGARIRVVKLRLGDEFIELTEFLTPKGRPIPVDSRSNDLWFQHIAIVVSDMEKAYQRLREFKVQHVSTAPQRIPDWNRAAAGIEAFYFRDPDGHNLEIIYFPPGKGDPRWQQNREKLFLGIDHTAIGVEHSEAGLKFYRDLLGLKVAGASENYGSEQEHLNLVFGARLLITGLRAGKGPGIEFLDYLTPAGGRSYPADAAPNDLLHWQTTLTVENLEQLAAKLRGENVAFISSAITGISLNSPEPARYLLVRDPDGHALLLRESQTAQSQVQK